MEEALNIIPTVEKIKMISGILMYVLDVVHLSAIFSLKPSLKPNSSGTD